MRKELKEGTKINPQIISAYSDLNNQQQMITSLHSYLVFALLLVIGGLLCVWWGFGGLNTRFLMKFSPLTRSVVAWVAVTITLISMLFSAYLFGVIHNARKHLEKDIEVYNTNFPHAKFERKSNK